MSVERFKGCLLGLAIGDSFGAETEGYFFPIEVNMAQRYTDDTAMMIGVAESLIECRGFDGEEMAKRFIMNYLREPWRGYGPGPPTIFRMILYEGRRWDEMLDRKIYPGGSFGNGAAMRVAPLGLYYFDEPVKLREVVKKASIITHSHELAIEGAFLQAYAVALALITEVDTLDRYEFLKKLMEAAKNDEYIRKLKKIEELLSLKASKLDVVRYLGCGVEAINSVPTAIYSFLSNDDFERSVLFAVSLGGDTDTIGAMTGAIAGAYYGVEKIPRGWIEKLENREYIEKLAHKLWKLKFEGSCL